MMCARVPVHTLRALNLPVVPFDSDHLQVYVQSEDPRAVSFRISIVYETDQGLRGDAGVLPNHQPTRFGFYSFLIPPNTRKIISIHVEELKPTREATFND